MKTNKITIITPTYNRSHTLHRVYESLKKQSFKDFTWIIMDDGSTDGTDKLVQDYINENKIDIDYYWNENQHKFITVFQGIEKIKTPYFVIYDSDDSYPDDALETLYNEIIKIENPQDYISVMGLSQFENGTIVGHQYPGNGFDGSIFDMRYKHKVRGDKNGMFITETYQKWLKNFNYNNYSGHGYIPQSVFFNTYDAKGIKTRFVNKVVRNYFLDEDDKNSVSNTRWTGKNTFGLTEGYRSFLNSYYKQLEKYPLVLFRNLIGYQYYALYNKRSFKEINAGLQHFKVLSVLVYPLSLLYKLIK